MTSSNSEQRKGKSFQSEQSRCHLVQVRSNFFHPACQRTNERTDDRHLGKFPFLICSFFSHHHRQVWPPWGRIGPTSFHPHLCHPPLHPIQPIFWRRSSMNDQWGAVGNNEQRRKPGLGHGGQGGGKSERETLPAPFVDAHPIGYKCNICTRWSEESSFILSSLCSHPSTIL